MRASPEWLSQSRTRVLAATLGLVLTLSGCASVRDDPRQATEWAPCARSRPAAFTILCIQQPAVVSER